MTHVLLTHRIKVLKKDQRRYNTFCTSCNYMTSTTIYFKKHLKISHSPDSDVSKVITCTECEYQTLDPISANEHKRSKHLGETRYYCDICGLTSFYRNHVRIHIKSRHNKTNGRVKSVECTKCQTNEEHDTCLATQHNTSSQKGPKSTQQFCTSCNYITSTTIYFKKHMKLSHSPDSDLSKVITCPECEFQTLSPSLAEKHNRSKHLQENKYYCDMCGFQSLYRHHIRQHIGRHKGTNARVKSNHCTQCQSNVET